MADNQVKFKRGSASEYAALETKDPDDIYITTDDGKIYLGDKALGGGGGSGGGTTYTFKGGTNKITVTPSDTGVAQDVDITISVPTANTTKAGITKLYTATGTNTDGTMTQAAITEAIGSGDSSKIETIFSGSLSLTSTVFARLPDDKVLNDYKLFIATFVNKSSPYQTHTIMFNADLLYDTKHTINAKYYSDLGGWNFYVSSSKFELRTNTDLVSVASYDSRSELQNMTTIYLNGNRASPSSTSYDYNYAMLWGVLK